MKSTSARHTANIRRAAVLAALLVLSALAAVVLNKEPSGGEERGLAEQQLWSSRYTRTVIGQVKDAFFWFDAVRQEFCSVEHLY